MSGSCRFRKTNKQRGKSPGGVKTKGETSMYYIGVDAGSVAVKLVVLDENGKRLEDHYIRHYGHSVGETLKLLREIKERYPACSLSVTGSAGKMIARALKIKPLNEIVSQAYSIKKLFPHIRTIIELGGEDSKLIILDDGRIKDFAMNSVCAAGTGSFLEQQAERLRLSIEEFSEIATSSKRPAKIAGRCSVFAKTDMIHLQQIATPTEDIVAGLCFAVARNFKGTIAKGMEVKSPVAFQGGVAANKGMIRAFRETFEFDDLFVPPDFKLMGAIGAALKNIEEGAINHFDLGELELFSSLKSEEQGFEPLVSGGEDFFERHKRHNGRDKTPIAGGHRENEIRPHGHKIKAYLGIDIGSISTNLAVIDEDANLLSKRYLMTAGRPIEAVMQGLRGVYAEIGDDVEILGVGTTGSGRYMIADYVGADIVKNEITAQASAAIFINPDVDTIFEIGGQDSKYISIRDGIIVDFEMNKACAAGTGSFIEEQAEKLNISVKGEFAEQAFHSKNPCRLGERCTVFMENSLMSSLQRGTDKDDLLAGLAYSIVQNYINRVVTSKPIGENIFFQGGVAFNKSIVAAFEKYLGKKIIVPPNHDVTGAIGMALIAMEHMRERGNSESSFKGWGISDRRYEISSFECNGCPNVCRINKVKSQDEKTLLFYGGRCEKYDVRRAQKKTTPDLFAFREEMLWKRHNKYSEDFIGKKDDSLSVPRSASKIRIGLPYIFYLQDYLPFWSTLLWELGFEVVSPKTNKQIVNLGVENVTTEVCFPMKVAHGHIKYLEDAGVDVMFAPSFINLSQSGDEYERGVACPYVQAIPYVAEAAIGGIKTVTPVIDLGRGKGYLKGELKRVFRGYDIKKGNIDKAIALARSSQEEFQKALRDKGREALDEIKGRGLGIVIIGRAYNAFDPGVNLEIPRKLSLSDVLSIPLDFLPLDDEKIRDVWPNMQWRSGQKILKAASIIRNTADLYAIYLSNFSCGPDSFILKYFADEMKGKPFLHIEIDEHSADAGAITRCEAFLNSVEQQRIKAKDRIREWQREDIGRLQTPAHSSFSTKRTIFIPRMTDHAFALKSAFEYCGISADVLPEADKETLDIGKRYVSGKECYPYLITVGDMLKRIFSPGFKPEESAFFMPAGRGGPCRFAQYNISHKRILKGLGLEEVVIFAPSQDTRFYKDLGIVGSDFTKRAWTGIVAYELLLKCLHETRPYEKMKGDADNLYKTYHDRIYHGIKARNGDIEGILRDMKAAFISIPKNREERPLIGIIGEIFVRLNKFSNEDLVRKIESMGGEASVAPFGEWIHYVNTVSFRRAWTEKDWAAMMRIFLKESVQSRIEHKLGRHLNGSLKTLREPEIKEIFQKASPYVHDSFEGETILSVGKAVDFMERGAAGIINTMPFGCMPGAIVTALMKTASKRHGVQCINIPYDGTESPTTELQIEAFMEAVRG